MLPADPTTILRFRQQRACKGKETEPERGEQLAQGMVGRKQRADPLPPASDTSCLWPHTLHVAPSTEAKILTDVANTSEMTITPEGIIPASSVNFFHAHSSTTQRWPRAGPPEAPQHGASLGVWPATEAAPAAQATRTHHTPTASCAFYEPTSRQTSMWY